MNRALGLIGMCSAVVVGYHLGAGSAGSANFRLFLTIALFVGGALVFLGGKWNE